VFNDRGELRLPVRFDHGLRPGCVSTPNGYWIQRGGTVNFLSCARETDMGFGAAFHENRVEVELPHVPKAPGVYPVEIDPEKSWLPEFEVTAPGYWLQVVAQRDGTGNWVFAPAPEPHIQASLVALEVETGKILALVGGYDFFESQTGSKLIHPFQGMYQPGSCFKPILFACAYSRGMTPSDTIDELPLEYAIGSRTWSIENFESTRWNPSLHGVTPLRRALVKSMNVASVHLWNLLTQDNRHTTVVTFARDNMGLRSPVRLERASALGACEVYPIELDIHG